MKNNPRTYQVSLIEAAYRLLLDESKPIVLASGCGAGKTFMSIYIIERYLKEHHGKVLVLTHGRRELRGQYHDDLVEQAPNFKFAEITPRVDLMTKYRNNDVIVTIPQTINKIQQLPHFDFLVVDEAHHYYQAKFVSRITEQIKPKHQLLLTGSPSPFIYANKLSEQFNIVFFTMGQLLRAKAISDVVVELATTTYPVNGFDYEGDELPRSFEVSEKETHATLDRLLFSVVNKLKSLSRTNPVAYRYASLFLDWVPALGSLKKTMIACRSIKESIAVEKYFKQKGIKYVRSVSQKRGDADLDIDPRVLKEFKTNDIPLLIVVGRGILGFNMPELVNVIDMTGSRNLNRCTQLMSRVSRNHPEGVGKLYFKVVSEQMRDYFCHFIAAMGSMMHELWYKNFDGFNGMDLPFPFKVRSSEERDDFQYTGYRRHKPKKLPVWSSDLPLIAQFEELTPTNSDLSTIRWSTFGQIVSQRFELQDYVEQAEQYVKEHGMLHSPDIMERRGFGNLVKTIKLFPETFAQLPKAKSQWEKKDWKSVQLSEG